MAVKTSKGLTQKLFASYALSYDPDTVDTMFSCFEPLRGQAENATKAICYNIDRNDNTATEVSGEITQKLLNELDQVRGERDLSSFELKVSCYSPSHWRPNLTERECVIR